jgi:hypothetical protein
MEKLYCTVIYDDECPTVHHTMAKNKKQAIEIFWKYLEENSEWKREEIEDMVTIFSFQVKVGESIVCK